MEIPTDESVADQTDQVDQTADKEEPSTSNDQETDSDTEEPSQKGEDNTSDDKNIPFHKHPRFKEIIQARRDAERKAAAAELEKSEILKAIKQNQQPQVTEEAPEWFKEGFGDAPDLWAKYNQYNRQSRDSIKQEILQEIAQQEQAKTQRFNEGKQIVRREMDRLKDAGHDFDERKLEKLMIDYELIDFDKAIRLYKQLEGDDGTAAKKKIASSTRPSGSAEGESKVKTLGDMINKRW